MRTSPHKHLPLQTAQMVAPRARTATWPEFRCWDWMSFTGTTLFLGRGTLNHSHPEKWPCTGIVGHFLTIKLGLTFCSLEVPFLHLWTKLLSNGRSNYAPTILFCVFDQNIDRLIGRVNSNDCQGSVWGRGIDYSWLCCVCSEEAAEKACWEEVTRVTGICSSSL